MHTVAANAYIAYRALRGHLRDESWPPGVDPLCALILRFVWLNGSTLSVAGIRVEFALPPSTLSSALGRMERRGYLRRYQYPSDGRHVVATLTRLGRSIAPLVAELIDELERDVDTAAGPGDPRGFDRVAAILAIFREEADPT